MKLVPKLFLSLWFAAFVGCSQAKLDGEVLPYTSELPAIDKAEIQKVKGLDRIDQIEANQTLTGNEAQALAALWRSQDYGGAVAACHEPVYAIKFFVKDKAILYATVCYGCQNIVFLEPQLKRLLGFNAANHKGQELLQIFKTAFPDPKSNSN